MKQEQSQRDLIAVLVAEAERPPAYTKMCWQYRPTQEACGICPLHPLLPTFNLA